ncbi:hypothetical protein JAAARDRAFT_47667 [Jaapia argillacea MUCL 33604]|uniref:Uncharacterized protein n=1 Tax=Jaapia argillacea MUCL 33604 TaxID=933084 RepID=A0A067Q0D3_9AGAM|nr:hypothetical protein JAAARDRAFT_47667 [Jaapia argillacea MUCL 33604]
MWSVLGENYMSDRMNYWQNTTMYLLQIVRHFNHSVILEGAKSNWRCPAFDQFLIREFHGLPHTAINLNKVMKDRQVNINVDCMDLDWEDFAKQYPIDFGADNDGNPIPFWTEGRVDVILKQIKNEFELMKKEDKATETNCKKSAKEYDDDYSPCPKPKKGQKKRTRNSSDEEIVIPPGQIICRPIVKAMRKKVNISTNSRELTPSSHSQEDDNDNTMDQDPSINLFNGSRGDSDPLKAFMTKQSKYIELSQTG